MSPSPKLSSVVVRSGHVPAVFQALSVSVLVSSCICSLRILLRAPDHQNPSTPRVLGKAAKCGSSVQGGGGLSGQKWQCGFRLSDGAVWTGHHGLRLPGVLPTQQASTVSSSCSDASDPSRRLFQLLLATPQFTDGSQATCPKPHGQHLPRYEIRSTLLECADGYANSYPFI